MLLQEMTITTPTGVKVCVMAKPAHTTLAIPGGVVNHPIRVMEILKVDVSQKGNYSTNVDWKQFAKLAHANGLDFLYCPRAMKKMAVALGEEVDMDSLI